MDHNVERKYFLEKTADYVRALEEHSGEVHLRDDSHVLFLVSSRPFDAMAFISEDYDLITVTTRTVDLPATKFEDAVKNLQATLEICWDHCVAVTPVDTHYDLSMAIFIGGFTFEAFEGVIFNLLSCAEAIEQKVQKKKE